MSLKVPLAKILKVKPENVIKFFLVPLGTKVKPGDLLASKKSFLGRKTEVRAEVEGVLASLSSSTGELLIETEPKKGKKGSDRKVATLKKSSVSSVLGVFGFGKGEGELVVLSECLEFTRLKKDFAGKVIFAPTMATATCLFKASALGLEGLVVAFLKDSYEDIEKETSGKVNLGFLILGKSKDEKIIEKVKKWEGKKVKVEGERKEMVCV